MIISHKYQFIFIKTLKTAGTSMEIALSKYLGEDDIVTPLHYIDERIRKSLGYVSPQNYHLKWPNWDLRDYKYFFRMHKPHYFGGHASAKFIKKHVSKKLWNNYYKFCFDRNPWDKAISLYYWQTRNHKIRPSFETYFHHVNKQKLSNFRKYSINDEVAVDKVYRYENLPTAIIEISELLNLSGTLKLPKTKNKYNTDDKKSFIWSSPLYNKVKEICCREIELLAYD